MVACAGPSPVPLGLSHPFGMDDGDIVLASALFSASPWDLNEETNLCFGAVLAKMDDNKIPCLLGCSASGTAL